MVASATNAWSCINVMRVLGVSAATKAAILAKWEAGMAPPSTTRTIDPAQVDDGVNYLTVNGFATFDGTTVTATNVDIDGRPKRLRRKLNDAFNLELLPSGATPQDGT